MDRIEREAAAYEDAKAELGRQLDERADELHEIFVRDPNTISAEISDLLAGWWSDTDRKDGRPWSADGKAKQECADALIREMIRQATYTGIEGRSKIGQLVAQHIYSVATDAAKTELGID